MSSSRMDRWTDGWTDGASQRLKEEDIGWKEEGVVECRSVGFSRAEANKKKNNQEVPVVEEGSDETDGGIISTASLRIKSHAE